MSNPAPKPAPESTDNQPVTVAIAPNEITAHLLQHVLDVQDVEAHVLGGTANQMMYWGGLVEVRLEVRRGDYELARASLEAFVERLGTTIPEHRHRAHCVVCGYDRAGLEPDTLCPECGAEPSLKSIDAGNFRIVGSPGDGSHATASFFGYAVAIIVLLVLIIGIASVMGFI